MEQLTQQIESLIFATDHPISADEISASLEEAFGMQFPMPQIVGAIEELQQRYQDPQYAFEIIAIAGGYQFLTKGAYHNVVGIYLKQITNKRLSRSALETLSIIAYKQPVTKGDLEKIRGVSCDYAIQKLLEKELVTILGRSEGVGRPLLYGTSEKFMDYFGLTSLEDLPKPKEFKEAENSIGERAPIEEAPQSEEE